MMKPLRFFIMALLCAVTNVAWGETVTGIIYFGNNGTKIDKTSVTDKDNLGNDWTITITFSNNNYFSQSNDFSQVGSSNNPASTITFETELPTNQTIKNFEAKFGGFSNTAGDVTLKVNNNEVGTGSLNGTADVIVKSTSVATGNVLRVTVTNIKKGVKCYYISYSYEDNSNPTVATPTFSPAGGKYTSTQNVTISCDTDDATIHYTTDGTTPTTSSATYGSAIHVSSTTTIKAIAVAEGMDNSAVAEATYTFPSTISEARAMDIGSDVYFKGVVTSSVNGMNFLQDDNAAICVYSGQFTVGSEYTVQGTTQNYNGLLQVKSGHTDTEINTGQTMTPEVMTVAETLDNSTITADKQGWLVKIEDAVVTAKTNDFTTVKQGESSINVYGISGDYAEKDKITFTGNISYNNNSARIANSKLISVKKAPFLTISSESVTVPQEGEEGAFDINTNVDFDNVTTSFNYYESESQETPSTTLPDWLTLTISEDHETINYKVEANNGAARSAYFELVLTSSEFDGGKLVSNMFSISQDKYVDPASMKTYKIVTDASELKDGDAILIVGEDNGNYFAMNEQRTNNRGAESVSVENGTITTNVQEFKIKIDNNKFSFFDEKEQGYLYAASSTANNLKTQTQLNDNGRATITISNNNLAKIEFQGSNNRNLMRFNPNNGSPIFSCYNSTSNTGSLVQIYKEVKEEPVPESFVLTINSKFTDGNGNYFATISNLGDGNFVIPAGLEVSTITIVDRNIKKTKSFQADDVIPGKDVAYYVVASVEDASAADALTFEFEPTTDAVSDNLEEYDNWLYPAIAGEIITAPSSDVDYLFYKLTTKNGKNPGFYWGAANGAPFEFTSEHKAYLAVPQVDDNNAGLSSIAIDDTNGINDIENANEQSDEVYTISGVRVKGNLSKGVYIVNGKKQIVK